MHEKKIIAALQREVAALRKALDGVAGVVEVLAETQDSPPRRRQNRKADRIEIAAADFNKYRKKKPAAGTAGIQ